MSLFALPPDYLRLKFIYPKRRILKYVLKTLITYSLLIVSRPILVRQVDICYLCFLPRCAFRLKPIPGFEFDYINASALEFADRLPLLTLHVGDVRTFQKLDSECSLAELTFGIEMRF